MAYTAAVITVSDKGARGERRDTSGPAICAILESRGWKIVYSSIIPDEAELIKRELIKCADELSVNLVLTTGGTGFSPRDVTPEATMAVVERPTPGIPEAMRCESMKVTSHGCLSRSAAGIRGRTLIVNLPGSERAAKENLMAVIDPVAHGLDMLLGSGSADCAQHHHYHHEHGHRAEVPSMDQWLREAKTSPDAGKIGMYLQHCGVVRETARARVRDGDENAPDVKAMRFSYDADKLEEIIAEGYTLPGIFYIKVWLAEGLLHPGDDIMRLLIGGDIRPNLVQALQHIVGRIKAECVEEEELS